MLTSQQVGLRCLKLYQTLQACPKNLPENAKLLSDSSDKHQLEIKDGARVQTSSKCRPREVKYQDGKKPKSSRIFDRAASYQFLARWWTGSEQTQEMFNHFQEQEA